MKNQLVVSLFFMAMMLAFSHPIMAQKVDSPIFIEAMKDLEAEDRVLPILNKASFGLQEKSSMKAVSAAFAQKYALPKNAKISTKPLVIFSLVQKTKTHCMQFSCADYCKNCYIVWVDRNGDGKIQPMAELRCMNADGVQNGLRVTRVECK